MVAAGKGKVVFGSRFVFDDRGMRSGRCPFRSRAVVEGAGGKGHPGQPGRHSETGKSGGMQGPYGAFRTTNTGALSAESGLLPAAAQQKAVRGETHRIVPGPSGPKGGSGVAGVGGTPRRPRQSYVW